MTHRAGFVGRMGPPSRRIYNTSAQNLFSRMSTQPDSTRKHIVNTAIVNLKTGGIWQKLDALWVMAAHDSQAAGLNWINSNYTLSPVNSPTFTADRGYAGDGVSSYLDTNYNPAVNGVNYQRDSASVGVWSRTAAQSMNSIVGYFNGTNGTLINPRSGVNNFSVRVNSAGATSLANADGSGFYTGNRSGASTMDAYKNGSQVATSTAASSPIVSANFLIGSATGTTFSANEISMFYSGGSLSLSEQATLYSIINTYMVGVGAA